MIEILNTPLCRITQEGTEFRVFIKMEGGGWLEHHPLPNDLKGLASALDLAISVVTGKFFPRAIVSDKAIGESRALNPGKSYERT
jgi:hypothetical protein